MRWDAEKTRMASMRTFNHQEKARESAEQIRSQRLQDLLEKAPKIIEDMRRAAAKQMDEMEKLTTSAREMLQETKQLLQQIKEQIKIFPS